MAQCPLEQPQCKRQVMTSSKPYERKQCPLNVKPTCALVPPSCPLLPPQENICGLSKLQNSGEPVPVGQCPGKCCCLPSLDECPISLGTTAEEETPKEWDKSLPPCLVEGCKSKVKATNVNVEKKREVVSKNEDVNTNYKGVVGEKKCPVSWTRRPLPCAECILDELASGDKGKKAKTCPFLKIPDMCGPLCKCEEVPEVDAGLRCPFLPKPCPCCATPRCPMTRVADSPLCPQPLCALSPPCSCGKNCLGVTLKELECEPPPSGCRCQSCLASCLKCPPMNPPTCYCDGCPVGSPCPFKAPKCVCGSCPPMFPCCLPKPCSSSCACGMCPLEKILCCEPTLCSIVCSLSKPSSCCPLSKDPCCLLKNPKCPPIPPPCSLDNKSLEVTPPKSTFHVPICPQYKPPCTEHFKPEGREEKVCPFSPHPCPLGPVCPFPVAVATTTKKEADTVSLPRDKRPQKQCPGSQKCGALPDPECPAAEILCPYTYVKKEKPSKVPCPFKKCMDKPECPFSKAKPEVDCPTPDCPMTKEPDCPVSELASRCGARPPCPCLPPPGCAFGSDPSKPGCTLNIRSETKSKRDETPSQKKNPSNDTELLELDGTTTGRKFPNPQLSDESSEDCPLSKCVPKLNCPLAPPRCPMTPKPKCPLVRKPEPCPLSRGKLNCPIEYPPCRKFPDGRCPMGELNICDCKYPVPPCFLPPPRDVVGPAQYCARENCCMGLGLPPYGLHSDNPEDQRLQSNDGYYYKFVDTKPGKEETKHYVQVMTEPPTLEIRLFGTPKRRVHDNWNVIKYGEGFKRCKTIAKKLEEMGPAENKAVQYCSNDCPLEPESIRLQECVEAHKKDDEEIRRFKKNLELKTFM